MGTGAARLEVVAGNAAGTSIVVEDELVIGRHAEGQGRLADDQEISRTHARITVDGSNFCAVEDLGSTNGTYVNGLQISAPQTLSEGDTIELGGTTLVVREVPGTPGAAAPEAPRPQPTVVTAEDAPGPPTAESEPAAEPVAPIPPNLELRLEVDFSNHEAHLFLGNVSEPVRLVWDGVAWRPASPLVADERNST